MLKEIVREVIAVDFADGISYGSDQVYITYPCRFATVSFQLFCTNLLTRIMDRMRTEKDKELMPMSPFDQYTDDMCDKTGWYDFSITINTYSKTKVCSCIEVIVDSYDAKDANEIYYISLNEYEQEIIFERLDEQCKHYLNKSCDELLQEAERLINNE